MEYVHAYVVENIEQTTTKQAKLLLWASYVSSLPSVQSRLYPL